MAKTENQDEVRIAGRKKTANLWIHIIMIVASLCCVIPFVLVVIVSFSSETSIYANGYSFFPKEWSTAAYEYLFANPIKVVRAYGVTIFSTIIGTIINLIISTMLAYTLSRKDYPYRGVITFIVFFTMLFNAGLVPTYMVYTNTLNIKNTILAQLVPGLLVNAWNVMMIRTYFTTNIPDSLAESAYLDGANDFWIYIKIVLPLSTPILGAMGFRAALSYWNNWYNSMIYVTDEKLYSLQYLMTKSLLDIQALKAVTDLTPEMQEALGTMPTETVRMAMAVVGAGPMLVVFPFFQKYFVKGITVGAVKG